jgi:hypothetical protein
MVLKMIEKTCPIMSRPIHVPQSESFNGYFVASSTTLFKVMCLREGCQAWDEKYGFCMMTQPGVG